MKPAPPLLHFSAAAETNGDSAGLDDHRYLAAAIRMLKHARETLVILEDVNILESNFAPGEILTGSRSIGSEILAKDKNRFVGHRFCSFRRLD